MQNHLWLLLAGLLAIALVLLNVGLLAAYRRWKAWRERERIEDALKHILDRERQNRLATADSLAAALGIGRANASRLIDSLAKQGLTKEQALGIALTADGERWGLHVLRAHRLWERFLADDARMPLKQVHTEAHHLEHGLTAAQLDEMDAALGYPTRDPHGDPIPTRAGALPRVDEVPLTEWQGDSPAVIVHLEDEPAVAFEQILAAGLRLGQTIRVLARSPQRILLSDGEQEYRLAPQVASNIHVSTLPASQMLRRTALPLSEVSLNQRAEIIMLDDAVQGFTRRRFLDLGLTPGTVIYPELSNSFRDPRGYRVRGTLIALRRDQAENIWVRLLPQELSPLAAAQSAGGSPG